MTLQITLEKSGKHNDLPYYLKIESIEHAFTRMPTQTGLPASGESFDAKIFLLDIGVKIEQLSLSGVVDDVAPDSTIPSKSEMETVVREWWGFGDNASNLLKIGLPNSQYYYGAIRNISFRKVAGIPDKWEFNITFLIESKV